MSGSLVRSATARPSRSPGSPGTGGLSWAGGPGGAGKDLGLDFVPCAPPSPEPERPHTPARACRECQFPSLCCGLLAGESSLLQGVCKSRPGLGEFAAPRPEQSSRGLPPRGHAAPGSLTCESFHPTRLWECPPLWWECPLDTVLKFRLRRAVRSLGLGVRRFRAPGEVAPLQSLHLPKWLLSVMVCESNDHRPQRCWAQSLAHSEHPVNTCSLYL